MLTGCGVGPAGRDAAAGATSALLHSVVATNSTAAVDRPVQASSMRLPPTGAAVDYQLGGSYPVPSGVGIVTRDSTARPAAGVYSICYVNGFQTQPQDRQEWLNAHPDLVLRRGGHPVVDENWPDEMFLDTSTAARRTAILQVVGPVLDHCRAAGFQAVEIDNLDSDTRSGGALTSADNLAMATAYVHRAHRLGLAIAQKNTAERAVTLQRRAGFDFAVAEECHRWDECAAYRAAYREQVIDIEYTDDLRGSFAAACADPDSPASMVLRDRLLVRAGEPGYVRRHC